MVNGWVDEGASLVGRLLRAQRARQDGRALVRAFYLEVRRNLALFDAVALDEEPPATAVLLATLPPLLSTDILGQLLLPGPGARAAYAQLAALPLSLRQEDDRLATASERLHSLWVRVAVLQAMASVPADSAVLRGSLQVRRRLRNIREDYLLLVSALAPLARPAPSLWSRLWGRRSGRGGRGVS